MGLCKAPRRKIAVGQEVLWSYNLNATNRRHPNFFCDSEWQPDSCCSEVEQSAVFSTLSTISEKEADIINDMQSAKRRKVGGARPHMNTAGIISNKPCTYCGVNMASELKSGKKMNMKCHWALKHTVNMCVEMNMKCHWALKHTVNMRVEMNMKCHWALKHTVNMCVEMNMKCHWALKHTVNMCVEMNMKCHWALKHTVNMCVEMGVEIDNIENPVLDKDFIKHLDKVDHVFNTLNSHNFKVVPACNFFEITKTPLLPPEATAEEKESVFKIFLDEGKSAFRKYQVVYLNGISIPQRYEDLIKPDKESNYDCVNWESNRPSGNNFSPTHYSLTDDENHSHSLDIKSSLMNAVLGWM